MTSRWHRHLKKVKFHPFFRKGGATNTFSGSCCQIFPSGCFVFLSFFQLKTYSKIVCAISSCMKGKRLVPSTGAETAIFVGSRASQTSCRCGWFFSDVQYKSSIRVSKNSFWHRGVRLCHFSRRESTKWAPKTSYKWGKQTALKNVTGVILI